MLNFRRLKQDFSPSLLKEGKALHDKGAVTQAKIVALSAHNVRITSEIEGSFEHMYHCDIEIDLGDSTFVDSDCNCPQEFDCQHLAALVFFLEKHYDELVVAFSNDTDIEEEVDEEEKETLLETIREAQSKEEIRRGRQFQKELLEEYVKASKILGQSPFFLPGEKNTFDNAELAVIFALPTDTTQPGATVELQLALRLPYRSKLLLVPNIGQFLESVRYEEPFYIGTRRFFFSDSSFDKSNLLILKRLMDFAVPFDTKSDKGLRYAAMGVETFGILLADLYDATLSTLPTNIVMREDEDPLPLSFTSIYQNGQEEPLRFCPRRAQLIFTLEYMETPARAILIKPSIHLGEETSLGGEGQHFFECALPSMINHNVFYRFPDTIKRNHLRNIAIMQELIIPEPLFGTFVENALPELMRYGKVLNREIIEKFVTMPFVSELKGVCEISYLEGELEANLSFLYKDLKIPAAPTQITIEQINSFVDKKGILARNLTEEQAILDDLFQGFTYDQHNGNYIARSDKKIIEFMTEVIPRNQSRVTFNCPKNLLEQFVYDDTQFTLSLKESDAINSYEVTLKVDGNLNGVTVDQLWECLSTKRSYLELGGRGQSRSKRNENTQKILVVDLDKISPVVQIFDEIGIRSLTNHKELRPLWSLANIDASQFEGLPIKFSMSKKLQIIQEQMLGLREIDAQPIPEEIQANLRKYQIEGVNWLERLRTMHLSGILADDMGLGKTLQAIIAVTQHKIEDPKSQTLIVSPTSLVYNWKEEFSKFNPRLTCIVIDGTPQHRRKLLSEIKNVDVIITSYSLLQKDTDIYKAIPFSYAILDEAQHIKNRGTRNAKSVKQVQAPHRLILTGTPIENSLDELWSLFDFLMPGLLSSYDRFVEKYIRGPKQGDNKAIETLKRKVSPFILRRMKKDVLKELPPVSELVYHCHLSDVQKDLYRSYAASAREELSQLVKKEGFDRVQIHVLATLTRLKQICCHPAIFAKESAEKGDSAKYDMLLELLQTLIEGRHKTVIFSQYTRMLSLMRDDFLKRGITFEYLDGSSKNRLDIVKRFNEDPAVSVFLVSLKAGGVGLNLVGADTVIHYDMWWNPAVENQATDRVHRIGQQVNVTSIKLVTLNTIEEKILELQRRKSGLVKKVVSCDEEAIAKLTWEEVLELLQT